MVMAPTPFWREVKAQAVAGTLVIVCTAICGGLGFLIYTVPRQLDQVLSNQTNFKGRLDDVERKVDDQGDRIIRLEARR
jgi:hypothetical protein